MSKWLDECTHKDAVLMSNSASCKVAGIETVRIKMFDGGTDQGSAE